MRGVGAPRLHLPGARLRPGGARPPDGLGNLEANNASGGRVPPPSPGARKNAPGRHAPPPRIERFPSPAPGFNSQDMRCRRRKTCDPCLESIPKPMKTKVQPGGLKLVTPPGEARRDTVSERRSAAHLEDPQRRWLGRDGRHDFRPQVAAGESPQRTRARQTEARTATQCHVRVPRRPAEDNQSG
jgi:hypothetical protein